MTPEAGKTGTIYIVEDDDAVRSALGLLARSNGWSVRLFASGQEFLDQSRRVNSELACLVVDLHMPALNGAELLEQLKAANQQMPTIVLTAWPEGKMASRALAAGADQVMAKPCNPAHWLRAVTAMLER